MKKRGYLYKLGLLSVLIIGLFVVAMPIALNVTTMDGRSLAEFDKLMGQGKTYFIVWRCLIYAALFFAFWIWSSRRLQAGQLDDAKRNALKNYRVRIPLYLVLIEIFIIQNSLELFLRS